MGNEIEEFLNDPENIACKNLSQVDPNSLNMCDGKTTFSDGKSGGGVSASDSGAACGGIGIVGGASSDTCQNSLSKRVTKEVETVKNCQKALYQFITKKTIKVLIQNQNNLFDSLVIQEEIFNTRLSFFEKELSQNVLIFNVISLYNFGILIIIIFFLIFTTNIR